MNLNDPVDKNASHFLVNVDLFFHVGHLRLIFELHFLHVPQNGPQVLSYLLNIIFFCSVHLLNTASLHLVYGDDPESVKSAVEASSMLLITGKGIPFRLRVRLIIAKLFRLTLNELGRHFRAGGRWLALRHLNLLTRRYIQIVVIAWVVS